MAKDIFNKLDLNLLRLFVVLYQERNMRKAAERLYVSQPAISQSLSKLRNQLSDELFVKVPKGLEPTYSAHELYTAVLPHIEALSNVINDSQGFDPKEYDKPIRVAIAPSLLALLSGTLFQALREQAPNAKLELMSWGSTTLEDIKNDRVSFGVNFDIAPESGEIFQKELLKHKGCVIVRKDHPLKAEVAELKDFDGLEIAAVINPDWNDDFVIAGEILKRQGHKYKVGFRSEVVMAVLDVIRHSDLYLPDSNLFPIEKYPDLRSIQVQHNGEPLGYYCYSYTHTKNRHSPMHHWLHELVFDLLQTQANNNGL